MLAKDYYIILTFNKTHLSNWFIQLLCYIKTGSPGRYAHALMNVDNVDDPTQSDKFKLMEATHAGVGWASFDDVFNCDRVCLLRPNKLPVEEWTKVIDKMVSEEGLMYDDLYDLTDSSRVSCVEMVRVALQAEDQYKNNFANLEFLIEVEHTLTPDMFRQCRDFDIALEIMK